MLFLIPFFFRDFVHEANDAHTSVASSDESIWNLSDSTFTYKVTTSTLPSTEGESLDCTIKSISVFRNIDNELIQTISLPDNSFFCSLPTDQRFIINDVNFDGINDVMIVQFMPSSPNIPYYYWIFNKEAQQFQRDSTLEEITSPNFKKDQKLITSSWRSGCCTHGLSTYKYINGKITLIEETEITDDTENPEQRITTRKKLINKEMKLTERTVEKN